MMAVQPTFSHIAPYHLGNLNSPATEKSTGFLPTSLAFTNIAVVMAYFSSEWCHDAIQHHTTFKHNEGFGHLTHTQMPLGVTVNIFRLFLWSFRIDAIWENMNVYVLEQRSLSILFQTFHRVVVLHFLFTYIQYMNKWCAKNNLSRDRDYINSIGVLYARADRELNVVIVALSHFLFRWKRGEHKFLFDMYIILLDTGSCHIRLASK